MTDTTQTAETTAQEPAPAPAPSPEQTRVSIRQRVAKELFGDEYYGEDKPKPEETKDEPKPDETPEGEGEPETEEEPEESGETPDEGDEAAPEEDTGEKNVETMSELAEHLQQTPEWVNSLKVAVKVDGRQSEVPLGEIIASYQKQEMVDQYLKEARDERHSVTQELAAKRTDLEGHFRTAAELVKSAEAILERDIKAVDPSLRDTDPAEWAARIQEFSQRRGQIDAMKQQTVQAFVAANQKDAEEKQAARDKFVEGQAQLLLQALPEWQDEAKAVQEKTAIAEYLVSNGFQQQELNDLTDHRHVLLVRKAWLYDQSRKQVDTAKKRVAKVPKVMKPGAPKPAEQRASERLAALKARMIKTGSIEDATAYQLAKRGVSR